jgi:hypothetical protein
MLMGSQENESKALDVRRIAGGQKNKIHTAANVAIVYIGLGEYDSAFEWLD